MQVTPANFEPLLQFLEYRERNQKPIIEEKNPFRMSVSCNNRSFQYLNFTLLVPCFRSTDNQINFNIDSRISGVYFESHTINDIDLLVIRSLEIITQNNKTTYNVKVYFQKNHLVEEIRMRASTCLNTLTVETKSAAYFSVYQVPSINFISLELSPKDLDRVSLAEIEDGQIIFMVHAENKEKSKVWIRDLNGYWSSEAVSKYKDNQYELSNGATYERDVFYKNFNSLNKLSMSSLSKTQGSLEKIKIFLQIPLMIKAEGIQDNTVLFYSFKNSNQFLYLPGIQERRAYLRINSKWQELKISSILPSAKEIEINFQWEHFLIQSPEGDRFNNQEVIRLNLNEVLTQQIELGIDVEPIFKTKGNR